MNMRVLVLSDIHAHYAALKAVEAAARECDLVMCAGDFVGYYCEVNESLDLVRSWNPVCVRGNHDDFLLNRCPASVPESVRFGIEFADRAIDPDHRRWLASLPLLWGGLVEDRSILLCHGSPFRPLEDYLYEDRIADASLDRFDFDVLIFGQTHRPLLQRDHRPVLLNPGSVGQSRGKRGGIACAALLETEPLHIEMLEYAYDPMIAVELARRNGAGEWITKHLT